MLKDKANQATVALALICVAGLFAMGLAAPIRFVYLGSEILIAILFACSLNLLMGYGGMLSFGHSAYYALAAYASGLLMTRWSWSMEAAMVAGPLIAALGAFLFGMLIVHGHRGEQSTFLMLSLAFSQLVFAVIYKWYDVTRGDDGISGVDATGWLADPRHYFIFVLGVVVACLWLLSRIKASPFGVTLQSIRDNPQRAEFNGVSIRSHQLAAFVIAGFFGGIAGSLYAFFSGTISPQIADWTASARPFLANTMGGVHSFWGPIFGVLTLETIGTQVGRYTEHSAIAVGLLAIGVGVFLPRGIVDLAQDLPGWLRRRRGEG